jgi:hypothetical protein
VNFQLVGIDEADEILDEVLRNEEMFGANRIRQHKGSAHEQVDDILLRGPTLSTGKTLADLWAETECVNYITMWQFPLIEEFIKYWSIRLRNDKIGRVIITRLGPGKRIHPHVDEGPVPEMYRRYHYVIQGDKDNLFFVEGKPQSMCSGELWCVDVTKEHSVINQSDRDRIHLIMDMH